MRFAFGVTGCTFALTVVAALMIALADPPSGAEYLRSEDLQTIGLSPSAFRSQRLLLPHAVISHQYSADVSGIRAVVSGEVRLGESRALFEETYEREVANARKRPLECMHRVTREAIGRGGAGEMMVTVHGVPFPQGVQITGETWIQEGNNYVHASVIEMDVPDEQVVPRRDWCLRQSRTIAMIMHGNVCDALPSH